LQTIAKLLKSNSQGTRAYWIERTPAVDYYWEFLGAQNALFFEGYRFTAPTTADSTIQGTAQHHFKVLSHASDPWVFWSSNG
jgi:hypothetical protein